MVSNENPTEPGRETSRSDVRDVNRGWPSAEVGSQFRNCVSVEVDVLGSPSLIVPTVSVNVQQH